MAIMLNYCKICRKYEYTTEDKNFQCKSCYRKAEENAVIKYSSNYKYDCCGNKILSKNGQEICKIPDHNTGQQIETLLNVSQKLFEEDRVTFFEIVSKLK